MYKSGRIKANHRLKTNDKKKLDLIVENNKNTFYQYFNGIHKNHHTISKEVGDVV